MYDQTKTAQNPALTMNGIIQNNTSNALGIASGYRMGWGPCRASGCAGFVKIPGSDGNICERCGYHYNEHD